MAQTAARQAAETIEEPAPDLQTSKELAGIRTSLEKIARTLEHIQQAVEKKAEKA